MNAAPIAEKTNAMYAQQNDRSILFAVPAKRQAESYRIAGQPLLFRVFAVVRPNGHGVTVNDFDVGTLAEHLDNSVRSAPFAAFAVLNAAVAQPARNFAEFLSEEDLDLGNLSEEALVAYWNQWLEQARSTNEVDANTYCHGVKLNPETRFVGDVPWPNPLVRAQSANRKRGLTPGTERLDLAPPR